MSFPIKFDFFLALRGRLPCQGEVDIPKSFRPKDLHVRISLNHKTECGELTRTWQICIDQCSYMKTISHKYRTVGDNTCAFSYLLDPVLQRHSL